MTRASRDAPLRARRSGHRRSPGEGGRLFDELLPQPVWWQKLRGPLLGGVEARRPETCRATRRWAWTGSRVPGAATPLPPRGPGWIFRGRLGIVAPGWAPTGFSLWKVARPSIFGYFVLRRDGRANRRRRRKRSKVRSVVGGPESKCCPQVSESPSAGGCRQVNGRLCTRGGFKWVHRCSNTNS